MIEPYNYSSLFPKYRVVYDSVWEHFYIEVLHTNIFGRSKWKPLETLYFSVFDENYITGYYKTVVDAWKQVDKYEYTEKVIVW